MDREEYIFNGILDVVLYFFVYILIPMVQITVGILMKANFMHVFAVVSMLGLFYDCFTRYKCTMERTARRKMMLVGISTMFLLSCSVAAVISNASGGVWPEFFNLAYAIIVLPVFIWIHDGWYVVKLELDL